MGITTYNRSNEIGVFLRNTLKPKSFEVENRMMKLYFGSKSGVTRQARKGATKTLNRYLFKAFEKIAKKRGAQSIYQHHIEVREHYDNAESLWNLYLTILQIDQR